MTYLQYMYNGTVLRCNDTLHLEVFIYLFSMYRHEADVKDEI